MATQPLPLSQETLAQFNQSLASESRRRKGSVSTRRSSRDQTHGTQRMPLADPSFSRQDSLSAARRLSFAGWLRGGSFSFSGLPLHQPIQETHLENTYRTGPDPAHRFSVSRTERILQDTLDGYLAGVSYEHDNCGLLSQTLADVVRTKLKDINPPRYKLVCQVVMGQRGQQGVRVASRGLFSTDTDSYATAVFQNQSIFTVAIVYAVYCE
ncbi:dynein light chain Tctex-type protein 2B isoform X2 [Trichomycterus rosablanca]